MRRVAVRSAQQHSLVVCEMLRPISVDVAIQCDFSEGEVYSYGNPEEAIGAVDMRVDTVSFFENGVGASDSNTASYVEGACCSNAEIPEEAIGERDIHVGTMSFESGVVAQDSVDASKEERANDCNVGGPKKANGVGILVGTVGVSKKQRAHGRRRRREGPPLSEGERVATGRLRCPAGLHARAQWAAMAGGWASALLGMGLCRGHACSHRLRPTWPEQGQPVRPAEPNYRQRLQLEIAWASLGHSGAPWSALLNRVGLRKYAAFQRQAGIAAARK